MILLICISLGGVRSPPPTIGHLVMIELCDLKYSISSMLGGILQITQNGFYTLQHVCAAMS